MNKENLNSSFTNLRYDLPSSVVVFFVAIPLCLGISLASGAPLLSGLLAGAIGGIVVGFLSGSSVSVAGPAAGLTSIVLSSIQDLGTFEAFATAVVLAGIIQIILGFINAGTIGHFFPSSVIKGMLAAIGIILILKQIPHAFGDDKDFEGDESFFQPDQQNTFTEILQSLTDFSTGALLISVCSMAILLFWGSKYITRNKWLSVIPGPLLAVLAGVFINIFFKQSGSNLELAPDHLVVLPRITDLSSFTFPDWSFLANKKIYVIAFTVALVASIETLLSIEAADKMDPFKRLTPLNRELKAQGIGNMLCGLLGGLPITSVIVRTSTNVASGGRTKASTVLHGLLLALSVLLIPHYLEFIPLASLAAILILVGFKLTSPVLWVNMWKRGQEQFLPFVITIVVIVFSNLLVGIAVGLAVSVFFVLRSNFQSALLKVNHGDTFLIKFTKDATFINKSVLINAFETIPPNSTVVIEGSSIQFFDNDIIEIISDFEKSAPVKNINVEIKRTKHALHNFFKTI